MARTKIRIDKPLLEEAVEAADKSEATTTAGAVIEAATVYYNENKAATFSVIKKSSVGLRIKEWNILIATKGKRGRGRPKGSGEESDSILVTWDWESHEVVRGRGVGNEVESRFVLGFSKWGWVVGYQSKETKQILKTQYPHCLRLVFKCLSRTQPYPEIAVKDIMTRTIAALEERFNCKIKIDPTVSEEDYGVLLDEAFKLNYCLVAHEHVQTTLRAKYPDHREIELNYNLFSYEDWEYGHNKGKIVAAPPAKPEPAVIKDSKGEPVVDSQKPVVDSSDEDEEQGEGKPMILTGAASTEGMES